MCLLLRASQWLSCKPQVRKRASHWLSCEESLRRSSTYRTVSHTVFVVMKLTLFPQRIVIKGTLRVATSFDIPIACQSHLDRLNASCTASATDRLLPEVSPGWRRSCTQHRHVLLSGPNRAIIRASVPDISLNVLQPSWQGSKLNLQGSLGCVSHTCTMIWTVLFIAKQSWTLSTIYTPKNTKKMSKTYLCTKWCSVFLIAPYQVSKFQIISKTNKLVLALTDSVGLQFESIISVTFFWVNKRHKIVTA